MVSVCVLTALPTKGLDPLHDPDAVQAPALLVDHVSEAALPATICVGSTLRLTMTGGGCGELLTTNCKLFALLPPAPEQVSVYE